MKKMVALLAAMMVAMSVSAWAADTAAPAKTEASRAETATPAKAETKPEVKSTKPKVKMRGGVGEQSSSPSGSVDDSSRHIWKSDH